MRDDLRTGVIRNTAWFAGLTAFLVLSIAGSVWRLSDRKERVSDLRLEVRRKRSKLEQGSSAQSRVVALAAAEAALADWREMTTSESRRIAEISARAQAAGVTIVSIGSVDVEREEQGLISSSQRVRGVGDYRQIAGFLAGLASLSGVPAIEDLEITTEDHEHLHLLQASLQITWYAPAPSGQDVPGAGAP